MIGASDPDKKKRLSGEDVSAKVLAKARCREQGTKKRRNGGHMKMIARKRKRPQPDVDSDDEHRKCLKIVTFKGTIDSEIIETKLFFSKLDKVSHTRGGYYLGCSTVSYSESSPEGIELIHGKTEDYDGILNRIKDGSIHMLVERKYPLYKELLQRMLDFRLEVEIESTTALDLIRFIKQQLNEE
ncbi:hypothetical protein Tco_0365093 [Tanacetum coccineum]